MRALQRMLQSETGGIQNYMATGVLILATLAAAVVVLAASGKIGDDFMAKVEKYLSIK